MQILFNNQTGRLLTIVVDGPAFSPLTISAPNCQLGGAVPCKVELLPGVEGDVITFDASAPAGSGGPAISGGGNCRAGPDIIDTETQGAREAGQVDFHVGGATITVECSPGSGWQ